MNIRCLKCRSNTENVHETKSFMANGRPCLRAKCHICGTNKFRFMAGQSGKGIAMTKIGKSKPPPFNTMPVELKGKGKRKMKGKGESIVDRALKHIPELHMPNPFGPAYNFLGPKLLGSNQ